MRYSYLQGMDPSGRMANPLFQSYAPKGSSIFFAHVYEGEAAGAQTSADAAENAFMIHNRDDRPRGQEIRSLSVGDVIVAWPEGEEPVALLCTNLGFSAVSADANARLADIAARKAYGVLSTKGLFAEPTGKRAKARL